jgi:sterol desaturase/sphingolipid hydroxylase (fatty acid hydroxylase superfamily)
VKHEATTRLACFIGVFALMAIGELLWPKRARPLARTRRWPNNITVVIIDTFLARIVLPAGATGVAFIAERHGWGLFNNVPLPRAISLIASVIILDLAIYAQHWVFHHMPWLWRLHRMHHADLDVDVTTGARFHPIEILLSLGLKAVIVIAIGAPAVSVLIFEVLLNATSMFNHTNVRIPASLEPMLRWLLVTPDMHRVHHSIVMRETNSNFGFNLPWWDRLFGTYRAQPEAGHEQMTLGLQQFRDPKELRIDRLLAQPFRKE